MKLQHILSLPLLVASTATAVAQNVHYEAYEPITDVSAERIQTTSGGQLDLLTDNIVSVTFTDEADLGTYASYDEADTQVQLLYHSRWYDNQRFIFEKSETLAGNLYSSSYPYLTMDVTTGDYELLNSYASLACVVDQARLCIARIDNPASQLTDPQRAQLKGECLTMEALAYFYLVRMAGKGIVNTDPADLFHPTWRLDGIEGRHVSDRFEMYDHIVALLTEAMGCLDRQAPLGRIGYYSAEGLLAKVYLAKASISGRLDAADLAKAASYAKDVIDNSGRKLLDDYSNNFKLAYNTNSESLIAFNWRADTDHWSYQNTLQNDLAMSKFGDHEDTWGDWTGPSVALQKAFGVNLLDNSTDSWLKNTDTRLKATMMLPGFTYDYFWQDKGGFDYLAFLYSSNGYLNSPTGANCVKHLYGNTNDHIKGVGYPDGRMKNALATHVLRLSDVYLIYAEAMLGANRQTSSDASVIDALYAVHHRADATYKRPAQVSWEDVWKERRLELALEGDRWFDFVRLSYIDFERCETELLDLRGRSYWNMNDVYSNFYNNGTWQPGNAMLSDFGNVYNARLLLTTDSDGVSYFALPISFDYFSSGNGSAMPE